MFALSSCFEVGYVPPVLVDDTLAQMEQRLTDVELTFYSDEKLSDTISSYVIQYGIVNKIPIEFELCRYFMRKFNMRYLLMERYSVDENNMAETMIYISREGNVELHYLADEVFRMVMNVIQIELWL